MNQMQFDHDMDSLRSPEDLREFDRDYEFRGNPIRQLFDNSPGKGAWEESFLDKDENMPMPPELCRTRRKAR